MSNRSFITFFITIHVVFIFLQIHKQSYVIELSYQKQKNEKLKQELTDKKNGLTQELHMVQNRSNIKKYAESSLGMKKISLSQIKKMPDEYSV